MKCGVSTQGVFTPIMQLGHTYSAAKVTPTKQGRTPPLQYRVEELAEAANIAVDTIRYYQRLQLLMPPQRQGRIAYYSDTHLERLSQIRALSNRGFTLAQITELTAGEASAPLANLAVRSATDPNLDRAELAKRSGVPEFMIDLVAAADLLASSGEGPAQRFAPEAVEMLAAARTLVSAGVSFEELTALAMRHATHIEDVVDDSIQLFKQHADRQQGNREELVALLAQLFPVVSGLVARHFEQTLVSRALARLGDEPTIGGGTFVLARRLRAPVDPLAVFATAKHMRRTLWIRGAADVSYVGLGAVKTIAPAGEGRFSATSAARVALAARTHRLGPENAPAPVLLGGFSFSCVEPGVVGAGVLGDCAEPGAVGAGAGSGVVGDCVEPGVVGDCVEPGAVGDCVEPGVVRRSDPDWTGFPDAMWVLPEITVVQRADETWLLAAAEVTGQQDDAVLSAALEARLDAFERTLPSPIGSPVAVKHGKPTSEDKQFQALVEEAVRAIGDDEFQKVVLARTHRQNSVDPIDVLHRLRHRYPSCAVFSVAVADRQFIGASPERLVELEGSEVHTEAVAGTVQIDPTKMAVGELHTVMLTSAKLRAEHQFVVDDIVGRLGSLGLRGKHQLQPEVMRLARVAHLCTPITAQVQRRFGGVSDMDVLRVGGVLHPTPAVAGTPTNKALEWILAREGFDRGWYGAPVGWCDLDGNGELCVALRSALISGSEAVLFSGAGVVAESKPGDELTETAVKLRALLDVMESYGDEW